MTLIERLETEQPSRELDREKVARAMHNAETGMPWIVLGEEAAPPQGKRSYWLRKAAALIAAYKRVELENEARHE
jgi:hypothetical protein